MKDRTIQRKRAGKVLFLALFIFTGFGALFVATTGYSGGRDDDPVKPVNGETFAVYSVEIPDKVTFAGEPVPLDLFDIKEALDRELLFPNHQAYQNGQPVLSPDRTCIKKESCPRRFQIPGCGRKRTHAGSFTGQGGRILAIDERNSARLRIGGELDG